MVSVPPNINTVSSEFTLSATIFNRNILKAFGAATACCAERVYTKGTLVFTFILSVKFTTTLAAVDFTKKPCPNPTILGAVKGELAAGVLMS